MSIKRQYLGILFELSWGMGAGEAVWFGQYLSREWFSLCLAWRGDGCGAGRLLPRASALLRSFPWLRIGEAAAYSELSVGWHSLHNSHHQCGCFQGKRSGPQLLSLSMERPPPSCWLTGSLPGWPSPGHHTMHMRTGGNWITHLLSLPGATTNPRGGSRLVLEPCVYIQIYINTDIF